MEHGAKVFGTEMTKRQLIHTIAEAADIPFHSLKNFISREPPKNQPYLIAVSNALATPIEQLVEGSQNQNEVRFYNRHPRFKYRGMRKLITQTRKNRKQTSRELGATLGIALSTVELMLIREVSNKENAEKVFTLLNLPNDFITPTSLKKMPTNRVSGSNLST